jgi:hypothetical protein
MKHTKKAALMLAMVPVVGALAFVDVSSAQASGNAIRSKDRTERSTATPKERGAGLSKLLNDHGKHRGWVGKNPNAKAWVTDVHGAIKDGDYARFKDLTHGTSLGSATTKSTFDSVVTAWDKIENKEYKEARDIMQGLADDGYRMKHLLRDSIRDKFGTK